MHFQARVGEKLADARLQRNLKKLAEKFVTARANVMTEIDFGATRQAAIERRNRVLERLDVWIEMFERNARRDRVICRDARPGIRACCKNCQAAPGQDGDEVEINGV
jgi:hypothetical protein